MNAVSQVVPTEFDDAQQTRIKRIFADQQARALALRSSNTIERLAKLRALRTAILSRQEEIYQACFADFKKPATEVDLTEITPVLAEIKHCEKNLRQWMRPQRVMPNMLMFGTKTRIRHEPKGSALIISPWNYPFNLTLMPLVSAVAAGCTAMIKPSELTPHCSALICEIIREVFVEQEVAVIEGGAETSTALLALPFEHIFFTGSPAVGKIVMTAAAKHLASVTLELGGKSPVVIDESVDIVKAAKSVMWGKFTNCGQTCIAPDYVLVHKTVKSRFLKECEKVLKQAYGKEPSKSPDYARMVNTHHFERVKSLIAQALDSGAKLFCGGDTDAAENFIAPTLLCDVPIDCDLMREEIFGPVLPAIEFSTLDEVIAHINAGPKPLALYVYTKNPRHAEQLITQTSAGGSCINQCVVQYLHINAPFGGVGNSGIGNSHGLWGFKAFSHERTVVENKFSMSHWLAPPYTDFVRRMLAITMASFK